MIDNIRLNNPPHHFKLTKNCTNCLYCGWDGDHSGAKYDYCHKNKFILKPYDYNEYVCNDWKDENEKCTPML